MYNLLLYYKTKDIQTYNVVPALSATLILDSKPPSPTYPSKIPASPPQEIPTVFVTFLEDNCYHSLATSSPSLRVSPLTPGQILVAPCRYSLVQ
jgi:hypothetical protein